MCTPAPCGVEFERIAARYPPPKRRVPEEVGGFIDRQGFPSIYVGRCHDTILLESRRSFDGPLKTMRSGFAEEWGNFSSEEFN